MEATEARAVAALKQAEIELARLRIIEREHSQLVKSLHRHALEHCADYPKIEQANEFEQLYAIAAVCEGRLCATEDLHAIIKDIRQVCDREAGNEVADEILELLNEAMR